MIAERLRRRAEIRRQIPNRKSVQTGEADRLADLLDEAADTVEALYESLEEVVAWYGKRDNRGDDSLLPPDQQEGEIARAMSALAKARGEQ